MILRTFVSKLRTYIWRRVIELKYELEFRIEGPKIGELENELKKELENELSSMNK